MALQVNEVIQMDLLQSLKWIAGKNGGDRLVEKVGVWDHETLDTISGSFEPNELILTNLLSIKDDLESLKLIVQSFIQTNVAGLVIKTIYFEDVPDDVKKMADEADFPILTYHTTYIEDIILQVGLANRLKDETVAMGQYIQKLLHGNLNPFAVRRMALTMNRYLKEQVVSAYIGVEESGLAFNKMIQAQKHTNPSLSIVPHGEGIFVVYSGEIEGYDGRGRDKLIESCKRWLNDVGLLEGFIGMSNKHGTLEQLDVALQEALVAHRYARARQRQLVEYKQIGVEKVIIPFVESAEMRRYFETYMGPLMDYDVTHGADWVNTLLMYIEYEGDYKEVARMLHQHPNTVRYRIDRIKHYLGFDEEQRGFYEMAVLICRLYPYLN